MGGEAEENPDDFLYNELPEDKKKEIIEQVVQLDSAFLQHERRDIWCFEPKGLAQRLQTFGQNTFEIWMIVGIIVIALINPSFISCFFVLLSSNLIYFASYSPKTRLFWGSVMLYFNFVVLIAMAVYKVVYL